MPSAFVRGAATVGAPPPAGVYVRRNSVSEMPSPDSASYLNSVTVALKGSFSSTEAGWEPGSAAALSRTVTACASPWFATASSVKANFAASPSGRWAASEVPTSNR